MVQIKTLSAAGDAVLVAEEGDVLRAYKCPAGVWTIGTGLTAASGVVKPRKGMVITQEQSRQLRREALSRNYEPRVVRALPTDKQHVFDAGVLFDWNTGAIDRASWVRLFLEGAVQRARASFLSWNKAGGKVVNGLTRRRHREWDILEFANYGTARTGSRAPSISAFGDHIHDFRALGYDTAKGEFTTIVAFQRDHDLKEDGLIGPATRAALQRALSAKANANVAKGGAVAGGAGGAGVDAVSAPTDAGVDPIMLAWIGGGAVALVALVLVCGWVWRNRGPLFAWLPEPIKDFSERHGLVLGRRVRT